MLVNRNLCLRYGFTILLLGLAFLTQAQFKAGDKIIKGEGGMQFSKEKEENLFEFRVESLYGSFIKDNSSINFEFLADDYRFKQILQYRQQEDVTHIMRFALIHAYYKYFQAKEKLIPFFHAGFGLSYIGYYSKNDSGGDGDFGLLARLGGGIIYMINDNLGLSNRLTLNYSANSFADNDNVSYITEPTINKSFYLNYNFGVVYFLRK